MDFNSILACTICSIPCLIVYALYLFWVRQKWTRARKRRLKLANKRRMVNLVMLGGGWCTRESQLPSCALHCFLFWFEWQCHSILTLVLQLLPSSGTSKRSGIGWKSPSIFQLRNGTETVHSMISATGVWTTLLSLLIRVMSMVCLSDSLVLNQLRLPLPVAMSPIWGLYLDPSSPIYFWMREFCL